jgi:hypothetical protein
MKKEEKKEKSIKRQQIITIAAFTDKKWEMCG